jgi:putative nucleotidyltransferase with HDIG domain
MTSTFYGKALLIESNHNFVNQLLADTELVQKFPITICHKINEGLALAQRTKLNYRIVYVSESMIDQASIDEVKEFMNSNPNIPIVLVKSGKNTNTKSSETLAIFDKVIFSPKCYKEFVDYCIGLFEARNDWNTNAATDGKKFEEFDNDENHFVGISLKEFVLTPKSFFNLHIKLAPNKFIKIINAGDEVTSEFIAKYANKGVTDLYISEDEHNKYLAFTGKITEKIVSDSSVAQEVKVRTTLKLGKNVMQNLEQLGINQQKLDHADKFLSQSVQIIRSMRMKNQTLKNFLDMLDSNEHSPTVALLASLIANEVGFESTKTIKQIGIGALLHDIGLFDLNPNFDEASSVGLTEEDLAIFEKHALHGAKILRDLGTFEDATCLMVEQHHLRRRGEQSSKRSTNINTATEIISVADEFFNTVIHNGQTPEKLEVFMDVSIKNFSPNIEKAMQRLLETNKRKRS